MKKKQLGISSFVLLIVAFLIYSITGFFSKLASKEVFFSVEYIAYLAIGLFFLGIYAILWQVILKKIPLNKAFLFKSMTVLFTLLIAYIFFKEVIVLKNIVGAALIITGIIINSKDVHP